MSNATVPASTTISKSAQKIIKGIDAAQLALRAVPHADATIVKPSDIRMSDSVANTALDLDATTLRYVAPWQDEQRSTEIRELATLPLKERLRRRQQERVA